MTGMILRPPHPADVRALSRLGIGSFVSKFGHMYRQEDLSAFLEETHSMAAVQAEMLNPRRRYCLAELNEALLGYCKLGLACGWPEHVRGKHVVELKQLYTDPAMTGIGIGARLMDWALAEARARGADEMQLSVWSGNDDAQRFYARYGFGKVADIHFMVGAQRDDEFLFARML